jgi:predicted RNase H-like nuclease (RuvC/YqgF family)
MATEQDAVITELNDKVERLIKRYIDSLEKERTLGEEVSRLQQQMRELESETQRLNKEIKTLKVANAISVGGGNSEARMRVGQIVREIDKCITLLNS